VEDDPDARQVTTAMLQMIGYRTVSACDEREALKVLKAGRPAAVLLDLHMPALDGIGFLDLARREIDYYNDLPIIAISGVYRNEALARPLKRRRVVAFVQKPFTLKRLRAGLEEAKVLELFPPMPPEQEDQPPADLTQDDLEDETGRPEAVVFPDGIEAFAEEVEAFEDEDKIEAEEDEEDEEDEEEGQSIPPVRPADSLRRAARVRMDSSPRGLGPTTSVVIPEPERAGEEHGEEPFFSVYFGAAIFVGSRVESVAITEVSAAGIRILADRPALEEGQRARVRAHVDLPKGHGLLDLTLQTEVVWTDDEGSKFQAGLHLRSVEPASGYAKLLASLARRQAR
jgi:CheY-like chemotaxis protein